MCAMLGTDSLVGQTISHYTSSRSSRGAWGVVYKAEDNCLKRLVALKFLPDTVSKDPQALARFKGEAQAAPHSTIRISALFTTSVKKPVQPLSPWSISMEWRWISVGKNGRYLRRVKQSGDIDTHASWHGHRHTSYMSPEQLQGCPVVDFWFSRPLTCAPDA